MREHLLTALKATGEMPAQLLTPPPPESLRYLLQWFGLLGSGRQYGAMGGPQPISWVELQSWAQATRTPVQPWEAKALKHLDALWCEAFANGRPKG